MMIFLFEFGTNLLAKSNITKNVLIIPYEITCDEQLLPEIINWRAISENNKTLLIAMYCHCFLEFLTATIQELSTDSLHNTLSQPSKHIMGNTERERILIQSVYTT